MKRKRSGAKWSPSPDESRQAAGEVFSRHPFLRTGPSPEAKAAFEAFLKAHGYEVAPVTVDNDDYEFSDVLGKAIESKDERLAERTKNAYLVYMNTAFDYYENVSRNLFHRELPQFF
jgi:peptidoglycan-N-acetylglucosamine deacetylase